MFQPKLVALFIAPNELACHWDIPSSIAEQIVRGVLQGGECFVRGRGPDGILRDIRREIVATLSPSVLASAVFSDVEIEWNGLVQQGRKLIPPEWEQFVQAAEARSADDAKPTPTAVAETRMKLWLRQQADDPRARKADIFAWAKSGELIGEEGKALGHRSFARAWKEAAPRAWRLAGPRTRLLRLSDIKSRG